MRYPHLLLSIALVALAPRGARATVMLKLELRDLVGRADVIFVGKATRVESRWSEDRRHIVTDTTFLVERGVRGALPGATVTVRHLGGSVGGIGMLIAGTPSFRVGEQALLFTDLRAGRRYVTGMSQGAYLVARDAGGRALVRNDLSKLALARRGADGRLEMLRHPPTSAEPLEAFLLRVQQTIAVCAKERDRCQSQ
jgi:hypothetical protein